MEIVIDNIEQFKVFFDVIYDISSDLLELQLVADRMSCSVLDGSHSCFFHIEFKSFFFRKYDVEDFGSVTIFVDDMYKLLKLTNKTDELTLRFDEYHMSAEIISKTGNKRVFEFVLPNDYIQSPPNPRDLSTICNVEVSVSEMKQSVKDIGLIGTHIFQIVANENCLMYMCDTTDFSESFNTTNYTQIIEVETGIEENVLSRFTLNHIKKMLNFDKISKTVELGIGNNFPLLFKFEDEVMGVRVNGMIAPRMEMED